MSGRHPWSEIRHKADERPTSEQRAWDEYVAWVRGAAEGQYEITEARAWERLQAARLRDTVVPCELELPADEQDQEPESLSPQS